VKAADVLELLAAVPLYVLGWLAGAIVRVSLWTWAALVAGYESGRGQT
jgi:hypothetical protein